VAKPDATGWTVEKSAAGDTYKSARISVFIAAPVPAQPRPDGSFFRGRGGTSAGLTRTVHDGQRGGRRAAAEYAGLADGGVNDKDDDSQLNYNRRQEDKQF